MARRKKDPLRPLAGDEKTFLQTLARARSAPADQVARATGILAVAAGKSYKEAANLCQQAQGMTVARWVARFNAEGIGAVAPRHGGGHVPRFTGEVRDKILATFRRAPDPKADGTAVWSITTLQKALARAGISISIYSLWGLLREEGYTFQKDRSWCHTGETKRKRIRKSGTVESGTVESGTVESGTVESGTVIETVVDPDTAAKKS